MSAGIEDLAVRVREARIAKALTQKELGKRVGLPQSHISKIEKGIVDLKLSSLVEIARALDLELTLVPRKALPAVEGAVRAHGATAETSRALSRLHKQTLIAERIKAEFPDISQVDDFQNAIRSISGLQFDAAQLKALDEALRPAKQLKRILDGQGGAAVLTKRIEEATSALRHFRNIQLRQEPLIAGPRQLPAYRLEDDDA